MREYVNSTITVACDSKRHSRVCVQNLGVRLGTEYIPQMSDPGKLVLAGYSAGSRSAPFFDWSRNVELKKPSAEFIQSHEMAVSSSFAIFYNLMCAQLPAELLDDLHAYLETNDFPRMDARGAMGAGEDGCGEYYVQRGEDTIVFCHEKLAPPAGVMGTNYARCAPLEPLCCVELMFSTGTCTPRSIHTSMVILGRQVGQLRSVDISMSQHMGSRSNSRQTRSSPGSHALSMVPASLGTGQTIHHHLLSRVSALSAVPGLPPHGGNTRPACCRSRKQWRKR